MHKFRHATQFAVIVACLVWGGYQVTAQVFAQPSATNAQITISDDALLEQYPGLPLPVARAIQSVVATQQTVDEAKNTGIVASGVILNNGQVLTAGHNVESDAGLACSQTKVIAPGLISDASASKDVVTHASVRYGKSADMALLTVRSSDNFKALKPAVIAKAQPEKGDTVYFINFQPTADGKVRSPAAQAGSDPASDYSKPAVFAGMVLGTTSDGIAIATGYGKSYGNGAPDTMARKGASGGAIVNNRGELIGLIVSSESLQANRTTASITKEFRIELPEQRYQLAHMQPIGQADIKKLQSSTVSCAQ